MIGKKKVSLKTLEKIDEEELEDSMKDTKEKNKLTPAQKVINNNDSQDLISPEPTKEILKFGKPKDSLPRWAQSVVGGSPDRKQDH